MITAGVITAGWVVMVMRLVLLALVPASLIGFRREARGAQAELGGQIARPFKEKNGKIEGFLCSIVTHVINGLIHTKKYGNCLVLYIPRLSPLRLLVPAGW